MALQLDLIQFIGQKSCAAASKLTEVVVSQPACTTGEVWNMGFLVFTAAALIISALVVHQRRKNFRETFMR